MREGDTVVVGVLLLSLSLSTKRVDAANPEQLLTIVCSRLCALTADCRNDDEWLSQFVNHYQSKRALNHWRCTEPLADWLVCSTPNIGAMPMINI